MTDVGPTAETDDAWDVAEGILPEQWSALAERNADDPCRKLWLAVFFQAIVALDRRARDMGATIAWMASDSEDIGAFLFICDALDLEPDCWRVALERLAMRPRGRPQKRRAPAASGETGAGDGLTTLAATGMGSIDDGVTEGESWRT